MLRRRQFLALAQRRARPGSGSSIEFLRARTWKATKMSLEQIQTPFVIVGGVATALYMPQRLTLDLDILVVPDQAARLHAELRRLGYTLRGQLAFGGTSWQAPEGDVLDVLESDEAWAQTAVREPNRAPTGEPVIALPYLVLMKLAASRPQDLADLSRMLGQADDRTLTQVRAAVRQYRPEDAGDVESLIALGRLELAAESEPNGA